MQTKYGKPPGYDLARQAEIGVKNIELTTMEEAFTSEHWIVRIFKIKKRIPVEPTDATPFSTAKGIDGMTNGGMRDHVDKKKDDGEVKTRYVGCYTSESHFGEKIYEGGSTGANYNLAMYQARTLGKKYFALARVDTDGHSFAFNSIASKFPKGNVQDGGCERSCQDADDKLCGCADHACTGPLPPGEEHNRRWSVYEI